jgi:predicted DNA-binding protein
MSNQYTFRLLKEDEDIQYILSKCPEREKSFIIRNALRQYLRKTDNNGAETVLKNPQKPRKEPVHTLVGTDSLESKLDKMF